MVDALKDAQEILGETEVEKPELTADESLAQNRSEFFKDLAKDFKDAPDEDKVAEWKTQAGRVKVIMFGEDEVYFFRALRSGEYKGLVQQVISAGKSMDAEAQNEMLKDKIVCTGILWPAQSVPDLAAQFAGTKDSLYTMIMQASNFLTPEEAAVMVQDL